MSKAKTAVKQPVTPAAVVKLTPKQAIKAAGESAHKFHSSNVGLAAEAKVGMKVMAGTCVYEIVEIKDGKVHLRDSKRPGSKPSVHALGHLNVGGFKVVPTVSQTKVAASKIDDGKATTAVDPVKPTKPTKAEQKTEKVKLPDPIRAKLLVAVSGDVPMARNETGVVAIMHDGAIMFEADKKRGNEYAWVEVSLNEIELL